MNAEERNIGQILTETLRYEIPPYQRPYSWNQDNVRELLDDIEEAYTEKDPEYFIGSLITIERDRNVLYEVVDGQQRLTTLNLIFAALRNSIEDKAAKLTIGNRILPSDPLTNQTETPRLTLRQSDQAFFVEHILESKNLSDTERNELDEPKSRLINNHEVVLNFLKERDQDWMKQFANYILQKVYVVLVQTESFQSAYRLFNVLNDRGLALSNADLIKNKLFARLSDETKSDALEEKWVKLESVTGIDRLDTFLGYHRTTLVANKARKSLADEFDTVLSKYSGSPLDFIDDVTQSAKNFERIWHIKFDDPSAVRSVAALWRVSYDEWVPALLAFLNQPPEGFSLSEFSSLLERITMQNWVRRLGRTKRLTIYYQLISAINSAKEAEKIRNIFSDGAENEEFFGLLGGAIYGLPSCKAILMRLEEGCQDESVTKQYGGRLTIEHVMPQALKDEFWKDRFSEETHSHWLHRLGNLTLLSGNKNYKAQYF